MNEEKERKGESRDKIRAYERNKVYLCAFTCMELIEG